MKVLFVDTSIEGHHQTYLRGLVENSCDDVCAYLPVEDAWLKEKGYMQVVHQIEWKEKSIIQYMNWIRGIVDTAKKFNPDIIHFLDGDTIMRYLGLGFGRLKKWPILITYHHFFEGKIREISYHLMLLGKKRGAIVHTKEIKNRFNLYNIRNVTHIEYPVFWYDEIVNRDSALCKKKLRLPSEIPVLGIIGATDRYKGTRVLLDAIKNIESRVCIYFAGKESDTTKKEIELYKSKPNVQMILNLKWLSREEYIDSIVASDYIILPYTREFNGASGPLAEGVVANKVIIGSNYGSLGKIITENELGYTFEVENSEDLANVIDNALKNKVSQCEKYSKYQMQLLPKEFFDKHRALYKCMISK